MTPLQFSGIGMTSQRTRDRLIARLVEQGIKNKELLEVINMTPRHIFVDEALSHRAYEDTALPIGFGQTISQPYIVAKMTELLLATGPKEKVLEVGTGCGYQTTVLSQLVSRVYSLERIERLQLRAIEKANLLGIDNVHFKIADGSWGWPEEGPYDGILVAAAPEKVPQDLLAQLTIGGLLIMPVGNDGSQTLIVIEREENNYKKRTIEPVRFVPMLPGIRKA